MGEHNSRERVNTAWNVFMETDAKLHDETWASFANRVADRFAPYMRTGIEERAVAACREYAKLWDNGGARQEVCIAIVAAGREIIAAETPRRWIAARVLNSQRWNVGKPDCHDGGIGSASFPLQFGSERDANLVAEALNKVDAEKA